MPVDWQTIGVVGGFAPAALPTRTLATVAGADVNGLAGVNTGGGGGSSGLQLVSGGTSTVSALTAASALDGSVLYYGVQGGADRKITQGQIATQTLTSIAALSAAGALGGSEPVVVIQGGVPVQTTTGAIAALGSGSGLPTTGGTMTGKLNTAVPTTATAMLNLPAGSAPTSPTNGDVWTTTSGLFARINGSTVGPMGTAGAPLGSATPLVNGSAAAGTSSNASHEDHIHPIDATRVAKAGDTMTGKLNTLATATGTAGLNVPHGTAPTSPVNGDLWSTTSGFFGRVNGSTVGPFGTGGGLPVNNPTSTGKLTTAASATGGAGFNMPAGAAPTSPANGDLWTTTSGVFAQINGSTVGPFGAGGGSFPGSAGAAVTDTDRLYTSQSSVSVYTTAAQWKTYFATAFGQGKTIDLNDPQYGLVLGAGVTSGQRTSNGTILQNQFNAAHGGGLGIILPFAIVEYTCSTLDVSGQNAGLQLKGGALFMRGDRNLTVLTQFATNHPVLTISEGSGGGVSYFREYSDFTLEYGVTQSGQTSAIAFLQGYNFGSIYTNINITRTNNPYIAWSHMSGTFFFNVIVNQLQAQGGQTNIYRMTVNGTGNIYNSLYFGGGDSTNRTTCSDAPFYIDSTLQGVYNQLNIEWINAATLMFMNNWFGGAISSLHIEGCQLTGTNPCVIHWIFTNTTITGMQLYNTAIETANFSGTATIIQTYLTSMGIINGLDMQFGTAGAFGTANQVFTMFTADTSVIDDSVIVVQNMSNRGTQIGFNWDPNTPSTTYGFTNWCWQATWSPYSYTTTERAQIEMKGTGPFTVYGMHRNCECWIGHAISADYNVVMSKWMRGGSGVGSGAPRLSGDRIVLIRYSSTTGSFNYQAKQPDATTTVTGSTMAVSGSDQHKVVINDASLATNAQFTGY